MILRIDHVGIAVRRLDARLPFWAETLGFDVAGIEDVAGGRGRVAFLPVAGSRIELLEATDPTSPIARFVDKRGEGLHHLTLEVRDLDAALERLSARGVRLARAAQPGA